MIESTVLAACGGSGCAFIMRVGVVHQNMMPMLNDRLL